MPQDMISIIQYHDFEFLRMIVSSPILCCTAGKLLIYNFDSFSAQLYIWRRLQHFSEEEKQHERKKTCIIPSEVQ
jgi:hypothetical protein